MKHYIRVTSSIEKFIENLSRQMQRVDVVNLLIRNHQTLSSMDFSSVTLDEKEELRASRLIQKSDSSSFILRRKLLKKILGNFRSANNYTPYFSHSNKKKSLFYSFSRNCEIGVDIEEISPDIDFFGIARLFFSDAEKAGLQNKKKSDKENFFQLWTRKEALAKCAQIPLQTILKMNLLSNKENLTSICIAGCNYSVYSYRRKRLYISIAIPKSLKTVTTYEFIGNL